MSERRDAAERLLRRAGPWLGGALLLVLLAALGWRATLAPEAGEDGDTRFYVRGARLFLEGKDLSWAPVEPSGYRPTTSYTYPPPFAAACVWTLPLPYVVVRGVWLLGMTGCALLAGAIALRLAAPARPALALALALPLFLRFGINDLAHGQTNWLVVLLLGTALLARARERDGLAGLSLGAALSIKPVAWPLVAWWLLGERRPRAALAALATLAGLLVLVPLPRYGPGGTAALLGSWLELMDHFARREASTPGNAAPVSVLFRALSPLEDPGRALLLLRGAALLWGAGAFAWLVRRRGGPGAPAAALLLGALLSPVTWKAHLVVLVFAALVLARRLADAPAGRAAWATWAGLVLLLNLPSGGLLRLGRLEELGSLAVATALLGWAAVRADAPAPPP